MSDSSQAKPFYCSFCGKSHGEVRKLIAGANANACDECVWLMVDIVNHDPVSEEGQRLAAALKDYHERAASLAPPQDQRAETQTTSFCCQALEHNSRRHEPNVAEELKSDAHLEYGRGGYWLLRSKEGDYNFAIFHCPWCGTKLTTRGD